MKKVPSFPLPASSENSPPTYPSYFIKTHTDTCVPIHTGMHTSSKTKNSGRYPMIRPDFKFFPCRQLEHY